MREGYDRWAATYDAISNPLVALDRRVALPLLGRIVDAERPA